MAVKAGSIPAHPAKPAGFRRTPCQAAPNMIVLGPVRRYQWGGISNPNGSALIIDLLASVFSLLVSLFDSGFRIEIRRE
ncbi:MAG: hypothetical protein ACLQFW_00095 [Xanthobacteraceae bacterium]